MTVLRGIKLLLRTCTCCLFFLALSGCINAQIRSSMEAQGFGFSPPTGTFQVPLTHSLPISISPVSSNIRGALVIPDSLANEINEQRIACSITDYKYIIRSGKQLQLYLQGQLSPHFGKLDIISRIDETRKDYDIYIEPSTPVISLDTKCSPGMLYDNGQITVQLTGTVTIKDPLGQILAETHYNKTQAGVLMQGIKKTADTLNKFVVEDERYPALEKVEQGPLFVAIGLLSVYNAAMAEASEALIKSEKFTVYAKKFEIESPKIATVETLKQGGEIKNGQANIASKDQSTTHSSKNKKGIKTIAPPTITITSPKMKRSLKFIAKEDTLSVTGKAKNSVDIVSVTVNGQLASLDAQGIFSTELSLQTGINQIIIEAVDSNNNRATKKFTVTRPAVKAALQKKSTPILRTESADIANDQEPAEDTPDELTTLIAKKDLTGLRTYLDAHPEALSSIKNASMRLRFTGPTDLRIIDIAQLVKEGKDDSLIIAQITSVAGPYKKFTALDLAALKKMAISDKLVAAMITVTTEDAKEQKRLSEQQITEQSAAPVQIVQEAPQQQAQQVPEQQQAPESNALTDCLKLAAALRVCDHAGGFFAMGCKMVARSQFNCPTL